MLTDENKITGSIVIGSFILIRYQNKGFHCNTQEYKTIVLTVVYTQLYINT